MTWHAIARKDFQDAIRSYWLWGLSALFIGVISLPPALIVLDVIQIAAPQQGEGSELTTDVFLFLLQDTMTVLVPIIAIVVAYAAIAGERDTGTLKLLLSLPHSRLDVVLGKIVGRGSVVVLPVFLGFLVSSIVFVGTPVSLAVWNFVSFAVLTALLGLVFVGIAVGISAAAQTARRAMIGTVGVYVLFTLLWGQFVNGVLQLLRDHTSLTLESRVPIHLFLSTLNPTQSYKSLVAILYTDEPLGARLQLVGGLLRQPYADALGNSVPAYLSDPAVFVLFVSWLVIFPLAGYLVFEEADL